MTCHLTMTCRRLARGSPRVFCLPTPPRARKFFPRIRFPMSARPFSFSVSASDARDAAMKIAWRGGCRRRWPDTVRARNAWRVRAALGFEPTRLSSLSAPCAFNATSEAAGLSGMGVPLMDGAPRRQRANAPTPPALQRPLPHSPRARTPVPRNPSPSAPPSDFFSACAPQTGLLHPSPHSHTSPRPSGRRSPKPDARALYPLCAPLPLCCRHRFPSSSPPRARHFPRQTPTVSQP
jgi:hypothetical protein